MTAITRWVRIAGPSLLVIALILIGVSLRISAALREPLEVDEAESAINALTVQQHGFPVSEYLGIPIYENTLTERWEGHPEYEFRDSSYSVKGVAVYHGWLPFYAIAASQMLMGITPDQPGDPPRVLHGGDELFRRMLAPRLPALFFSVGAMVAVFLLGRELGGVSTGLAALTWMALDADAVGLGYNARYYSLTMFMATTVAYSLWHTSKNGRWRDFLLLGFAEGLLFHTHQLSAVVFAVVSVASIPRIVRQEGWMSKSAAALTIAGVATIPWAALTGFFDTAGRVPKAYELFNSWTDFVFYVVIRPVPLVMLGVALMLIIAARFLPYPVAREFARRMRPVVPPILFLLWWMFVIYLAFHLMVPAASFFPQRLTLMMMTPYVVLLSVVIGGLCHLVNNRWSGLAAVGATVAVLLTTSRLEYRAGFLSNTAYEPLVEILMEREFEPGTRFYASPNHHLIWTYLTGIPVQSVAPVRREFLETYERPIVFLETVIWGPFVDPQLIREVGAEHGEELDREAVRRLQNAIWTNLALDDISKRHIPTPDQEVLPFYLGELVAAKKADWKNGERFFVEWMRRELALFRQIDVNRASDLWLAFFYRFCGYEDRIGTKANIMPRLQNAEVVPVPESYVVVYFCDPPVPITSVRETSTP